MTATVVRPKNKQVKEQLKEKQDPPLLREKLARCNQQCAAALRAIHNDQVSMTGNNLLKMWVQGRRIESLKREEMRRPRDDGELLNPVQIAAEIIGCSEGYANKMGQLYRAFPKESDRERLLGYRMKTSGKGLTWPHLEQLLKLFLPDGSNAAFEETLQATLTNEWTAEQVCAHIKLMRTMSGKKESRGGGRPTNIPPTFNGRAQRLLQQARALVKGVGEIYEHPTYNFLATVQGMGQGELAEKAPEVLNLVGQLEEQLRRVQEFCVKQLAAGLGLVRQHVERCVQAQSLSNGHTAASKLEAADQRR
jgi:hypothetical protein